jgi:hypothetical protein
MEFISTKVTADDFLKPLFKDKKEEQEFRERYIALITGLKEIVADVWNHGAQRTEASRNERDDVIEEACNDIINFMSGIE